MKKFLSIIVAVVLSWACQAFGQEAFKAGEFKSWAQTPPMGWNSWDCYGPTVEEAEVKANADFIAQNLKQYGWQYVVVDIRWFVENDHAGGYNEKDPRFVLDEWGRYQPAVNRFPSADGGKGFKPLADYVHSLGLKFGIHIMRGVPKEAVNHKLPIKGTNGITADKIYTPEGQCGWLHDNYTIVREKAGAQEYYNSIFELYASWGLDFIKIDDLSTPYHKDEIEMIRYAIDHCGRPIVLSTSPGETPVEEAEHLQQHANMWRMVGDVWDLWRDVDHLMDVAQKWAPYINEGTWPDCDMIPLGHIAIRGERGEPRETRLTTDEQYSLMSLFCIMRSPLMFGGDLPTSGQHTLAMLTNREVLRMHSESRDVRYLKNEKEGGVVITSRNPKTGEVYVALFNRHNEPLKVTATLASLGLKSAESVVNLWTGEKLTCSDEVGTTLRPHASLLVKVKGAPSDKAYVFTYFDTKKQAAGLCLAYSYDGYAWTPINGNRPIMCPMIGKDKLLRDPSFQEGPDGTFHLVWTSSWTDQIIGYASSKDLIHWSEQESIPVMKDFSEARNSWAPELFLDEESGIFYIFWASTVPGAKGVKTEGCLSEDNYNHRIYCCSTRDFKTFTKTKLWYNPDFNAIDAAVVKDPETGELLMAVKNEGLNPVEKNIRIARAKSMKKGFSKKVSASIHEGNYCEGPSPLFLGNDLIVFYDRYGVHQYGASLSHDHGNTWESVTDRILMPAGMSHGTAKEVDRAIVDQLTNYNF